MKKNTYSYLLKSLVAPVLLMNVLLLPLIFILVKRHFSLELIPLSLINGGIMTGGFLLNLFVFRQLSGKVKMGFIYLLIVICSAGFSTSGMLYVTITQPFFSLYGLEVLVSYNLIIFLIITTLSFFSCGLLSYQNQIIKEKEEKESEILLREEMERQIHSSRINPHFLFNSLNLMVALLDDREKAEDVLIRLSELLRYNLVASKLGEIPLKEELDSIRKYLFIQKERFGKRLQYIIEGTSESNIPPLLLQPLVENSIKHILDKGGLIQINIKIEERDKLLYIFIIDSEAALKPEMIGKGNGLEITRRRAELSGGKLEINDGGIEICLPIV
ncbi:MAG: hypothetical protein GY760_10590 [Deltaproteobacteria bacterium]|nr:hypothetical protein [Deltaproteobacteria bacterium]